MDSEIYSSWNEFNSSTVQYKEEKKKQQKSELCGLYLVLFCLVFYVVASLATMPMAISLWLLAEYHIFRNLCDNGL